MSPKASGTRQHPPTLQPIHPKQDPHHERPFARIDSPSAGDRDAGRQIQFGCGPRVHERRASLGQTAHAATPTRRAARQEHRRLHQRLPRLALGQLRPVIVESQRPPEGPAHRVPARRERRAGRHCVVGHTATGFCASGHQQVRWRVRHLVRQRPRRGPLLRRLQTRQHGGHHALGRRAGGGGR